VSNLRTDMYEIRDELKCEIKDTERRLSDKIDVIGTRFDEHEAKPASIAHPSA